MITTFLFCRRCGLLAPVPAAGDPRFSDEEAVHDLLAFRTEHAGHGLVDAQRSSDEAVADRPSWDPMATRWFQVTADAGDVLVVRCSRTSVDEARRYQLERTAVPVEAPLIEIDEPLLRRALDRHFFPHVLRAATLDAFVGMVRELVQRLDPAEVETSFDDALLPNASIGALPARICDALLARCDERFDGWELDRFRLFVTEHQHEDGALAVRVRRTVVAHAA